MLLRKTNVEGSGLLDCEGEGISLEKFQEECDEYERSWHQKRFRIFR